MMSRVRCVGFAILAGLTAASLCSAAEPNYGPRKGGVGGSLGFGLINGQGDYSEGARPRFSFAGHFRYVLTPSWRIQVGPGFGWAGYENGSRAPFTDLNFPSAGEDKGDYLTLVLPVPAELQYVMRVRSWTYHAGIGPGLYRVWVENRRKVVKDPATFDLHRGIYPGFTVELGGEHFLKNITTTSVEISSATHFVFAARDDQFPSGFNDNLRLTDLRIGVNYYFDLVRAKRAPGGLPGLSRP